MNKKITKSNIIQKSLFICVGAILWLLISYVMFLSSREEWLNARVQPKYAAVVEDMSNETKKLLSLVNNSEISQKIVVECEQYTGIALFFDGNITTDSGEVRVELTEKKSGESIGVWSRKAKDIILGEFNSFILDKQMQTETADEYMVSVAATQFDNSELYVSLMKAPENSDIQMYTDDIRSESIMEYRIINGNHNALRFVVTVLYLLMTLIFFTVVILFVCKANIEWVYAAFLVGIGLLYIVALPPYTVPDEASHFVTTYAHSSKLLGEQAFDDEGKIIVDNARLWGESESYPDKESYDMWFKGMLGMYEHDRGEISSRPPLEMRHPGYFPQVIGVTLARLFDFNPEQIFFTGRVFAALWYAFIMFWAVKIIPYGKMALMVIGALPMTMQMAISYNYDSVLLGVCFFLIAYLLYLIYQKEKVKVVDVLILTISGVVISSIKFIYLPIMALALLIPVEKFGSRKNKWGTGGIVLGTSAIFVLVVKLSMIVNLATPHTTFSVNPGESITPLYMVQHPIEMLHMFLRTFEHFGSFYVSSMIASPMGWLEIYLPDIIVIAFSMLLLFSFLYREKNEKEMSSSTRIVGIIIAIIMMFLALLALVLDCTNVGYGLVAGFQGRYWLPALPMFMFLFKNKILYSEGYGEGYMLLITGFLHCMTIFYLSLIIIGR